MVKRRLINSRQQGISTRLMTVNDNGNVFTQATLYNDSEIDNADYPRARCPERNS